MLITRQSLQSAFVGFNTAFQAGLAMSTSQWSQVATLVPSTTKTQEYGWLGQFPGMREWIGDRVVNGLARHGYALTNKSYETTIGVDRDDFEDDNLGIYGPMFQQLGQNATMFPDELVWGLIKNGFATKCYDGQYFFDTDHPVLDAAGNVTSVANTDGGTGTAWFLVDNSRALKPLIYQQRKPFSNLIRKDQESDDNVFFKKEYVYGLDGRCQVGFGFWQQAWGSKQTLNAANYEVARVGLGSLKADYGKPLAINPRLLIVPPSLEGAARKIVGNQLTDNGGTNQWYGTAEVLVCPYLA
ncbi:head protein [Agrobacterium vitis]|uniref:Mu-like prophage major head subunit gpT family protein n=1 Tax=Agrobacterium vitis TaxID=373 RepID=UPI0015D9EE28|nr:Mu-like prophage major head subunit gpT family protein [Agrobacterium vitis]BCH63217.1 head protein [Agrobacterium vitis]